MSKRFLKFAISILWSLSLGIPTLNAVPLDSNCESLKYQKNWPNYSKWSKGKFSTKYMLFNTTISCRESKFESCVVAHSDGTLSLIWADLADRKGNPSNFAKQYAMDDYNILRRFRREVKGFDPVTQEFSGFKIGTRNSFEVNPSSDDRFKVLDPNNTSSRILLSQIQVAPTERIFNWVVILDAYEYIVDQVNAGFQDDIKRNVVGTSGELIKNPKDMTFTERTSCAKLLVEKYKKGQQIKEQDLDACFAFQAYCTENLAIAGLSQDLEKYSRLGQHCMYVLDAKNSSKYSDKVKENCKTHLANNAASINASLNDLNNFVIKFNKATGKQLYQTQQYFAGLRDKYQKLANDMTALLEATKQDVKKEYQTQVNYNNATAMFGACSEMMNEDDPDYSNSYMQAIGSYTTAFSSAYTYEGLPVEATKTTATAKQEFEDFIRSTENDNSEYTLSLIKACNGITDIAKKKIITARDNNQKAMLASEAEYDVVAQVWNKTINQINELCDPGSFVPEYESSTLDAVKHDYDKEDAELMRRTTYANVSTYVDMPTREEIDFDADKLQIRPDIPEEKLKLAEELFNGLFTPVIEYEKNGVKEYIANPIPRLLLAGSFNKNTGLEGIFTSSFQGSCKGAYKSQRRVGVLQKAMSGMSLMLSEAEITRTMNSAIAQIDSDRNEICNRPTKSIKRVHSSTIEPEKEMQNNALVYANSDRITLIAKYMSYTPGLFQEYVMNEGAHPILCIVLMSAYNSEQFKKVIQPVVGVANIVLLIGSVIPIPVVSIPCRAGLVAISLADASIQINNIFEQLNTVNFIQTAVNGGLVNSQTGEYVEGQANDAIFSSYISIGFDALIVFSAAKGYKVADQVVKTVSTEPVFAYGFKKAFAKFAIGTMLYANTLGPAVATFTTRVAPVIEQTVNIGVRISENSPQVLKIFKDGARTTVNDTDAILKSFGMETRIASEYSQCLNSVSNISNIAPKTSMMVGNFISTAEINFLQSGVTMLKVVTNVGPNAYINYFVNNQGVINRTTYIAANAPANTEGGLGEPPVDGTPVDQNAVKEIDKAIAEYNKFCSDITGKI